jgi:hypothetical protein
MSIDVKSIDKSASEYGTFERRRSGEGRAQGPRYEGRSSFRR